MHIASNQTSKQPSTARRTGQAGLDRPAVSRRWLVAVGLICGLAFILRLAVAFQLDIPVISDALDYDRYARGLVTQSPVYGWPGQLMWHPLGSFTYRPPGYPWFIAAIYFVFGMRPEAVFVVQALLSALVVGASFFVALETGFRDEGFALIVSVLVALFSHQVLYTGVLYSEVLYEALVIASLLGVYWIRRSKRQLLAAAGVGLIAGFACITRTEAVVFVPLAAIWLLAAPAERPGAAWAARLPIPSVFLCASLLVVGLVVARNYQLQGRAMGVASNGGLNFYLGIQETPGLPDSELLQSKETVRAMGLPELEEERYFYQLAFAYLRSHPQTLPRVLAAKLYRTFLGPDSVWHYRPSWPVLLAEEIWWRFVFLGLFLFGGVLAVWRQRRELWLLLFSLAPLFVASTAFYGISRLRMPYMPEMLIVGCWGLFSTYRAWRQRPP